MIAPRLLWSEVTSALCEAQWRGELTPAAARDTLATFDRVPLEGRSELEISRGARDVAVRMGWAKAYDAEYCALAEMVGCNLVTGDERLLRGARGRLAYVVTIAEATAGLLSD
jgi:predicted nucleic acid-binding protein